MNFEIRCVVSIEADPFIMFHCTVIFMFSELCNSTNLPNLVSLVTTFRIIVLTYNRPWSLHRLLQSLENSHYDTRPAWDLVLEIRIDGGGGQQVRTSQMRAKLSEYI